MKQALKLARKGMGKTYPNPLVGAVIVKNDHIIGYGYHKKAGGPHAEIYAINSATKKLQGSTMYVNLEPHSYTGKTLPCTKAIIATGITRVVCATMDPNPKVQGDGINQLRNAGIEVLTGILEAEACLLNEQFFTFHKNKRPFIAVKYAASLDGKLSTNNGNSKWITNDAARAYGRKLRSKYQAILVGINTVIADDPHLGTRQVYKSDPIRIIPDSELRIPINAQVLRDKNVLIATSSSAPAAKKKQLIAKGYNVVNFDGPRVPINKLMTKLYELNIISVLIEGGGETIGEFTDQKLIDKVYGFYAPILIGGKNSVSIGGKGIANISEALQVARPRIKRFDDNFLIEGLTKNKD